MNRTTFRTEIEIPAAPFSLDPERPAVLLGSCFSTNIGARMRRCRWNAVVNPGGVLFNPVSIASQLQLAYLAMTEPETVRPLVRSTLFRNGDLYSSWLFDSGITSGSPEECERKAVEAIDKLLAAMRKADCLILTFGTSYVYNLAGRPDLTVANCHKMPAARFDRRFLDSEEILNIYGEIIPSLGQINPRMEIIFTVSPVRHIKDGFHANHISKVNLMQTIDLLCRKFGCHYFPAYEIMMDDLRDYRFYADDLLHPSDMAVDYIWEKFASCYLTEESRSLLEEGERLTARLGHLHIVAGSAAATAFDAESERLKQLFREKHPGML